MPSASLATPLETLLQALTAACMAFYGSRLVSVAVFGSVGRGTPRPDSDIDLLLVIESLPRGRISRMAEFQTVEDTLRPTLSEARNSGLNPRLSPFLKEPKEVLAGSPLFLDMTEDARILYDRNDFFQSALTRFKAKLDRLGARRIWRGDAWYWDLKPDYRWGDVIEL